MNTRARWYARAASSPLSATQGPFEVAYEIIDPPIIHRAGCFPSSFGGGVYTGYQSYEEANADIPRLQAHLKNRDVPADTWE